MSRPREFDEEAVLDKALQVFWRLGYERCSISVLTKATGLKRQSLYNAFIDKHGLFLSVIERYGALVERSLLPLESKNAGLPELRSYIENFLEIQRSGKFGACLLIKSAFGEEGRDPKIRAAIELNAEKVRSRFSQVIRQAREAGKLPEECDPTTFAIYLFTLLHGLSALIRTGGTSDQVHSALNHAFYNQTRTRNV